MKITRRESLMASIAVFLPGTLSLTQDSTPEPMLTHTLEAEDDQIIHVPGGRKIRIQIIKHTLVVPSSACKMELSKIANAIGKVNRKPFLGGPTESLLMTAFSRCRTSSNWRTRQPTEAATSLTYFERVCRGWNTFYHPNRRGWRRLSAYQSTDFAKLFRP